MTSHPKSGTNIVGANRGIPALPAPAGRADLDELERLARLAQALAGDNPKARMLGTVHRLVERRLAAVEGGCQAAPGAAPGV